MKDMKLMFGAGISLFALSMLGLTGCATSTQTIDSSQEAEVTFDGLHEVKGGRADKAWARPGVDI